MPAGPDEGAFAHLKAGARADPCILLREADVEFFPVAPPCAARRGLTPRMELGPGFGLRPGSR